MSRTSKTIDARKVACNERESLVGMITRWEKQTRAIHECFRRWGEVAGKPVVGNLLSPLADGDASFASSGFLRRRFDSQHAEAFLRGVDFEFELAQIAHPKHRIGSRRDWLQNRTGDIFRFELADSHGVQFDSFG